MPTPEEYLTRSHVHQMNHLLCYASLVTRHCMRLTRGRSFSNSRKASKNAIQGRY